MRMAWFYALFAASLIGSHRVRIFAYLVLMYVLLMKVCFMVKILFSVSNRVYGIMSFKVLYDVILDSLLDSIFNLNYEMDVFEIIRSVFMISSYGIMGN